MYNIDWALFANVVTPIGTVALAVVGAFAAIYAYRTAMAAINTLRLETEPILMVGVDPESPSPDRKAKVQESETGAFLFLPTASLEYTGAGYFTIKNVGRSPAMNVTVLLRIEEVAGGPKGRRWVGYPLFIESLSPQERLVIGIHNATSTVVTVNATSAVKASVTTKGKVEVAPLFVSSALPFPLG